MPSVESGSPQEAIDFNNPNWMDLFFSPAPLPLFSSLDKEAARQQVSEAINAACHTVVVALKPEYFNKLDEGAQKIARLLQEIEDVEDKYYLQLQSMVSAAITIRLVRERKANPDLILVAQLAPIAFAPQMTMNGKKQFLNLLVQAKCQESQLLTNSERLSYLAELAEKHYGGFKNEQPTSEDDNLLSDVCLIYRMTAANFYHEALTEGQNRQGFKLEDHLKDQLGRYYGRFDLVPQRVKEFAMVAAVNASTHSQPQYPLLTGEAKLLLDWMFGGRAVGTTTAGRSPHKDGLQGILLNAISDEVRQLLSSGRIQDIFYAQSSEKTLKND